MHELNLQSLNLRSILMVTQDDEVFTATPDRIVHQGDGVMAVGTQKDLHEMRRLLGEEVQTGMDMKGNVSVDDLDVVEYLLVGKPLPEMHIFEHYNVVITRVRRRGIELNPIGDVTLEIGDNIRVVGNDKSVEAFTELVQGSEQQPDETNLIPFLFGLWLGIMIGIIPVHLRGGMILTLGFAGGTYLVGLIVAHFGRIGPFRLTVPAMAKHLSRELGLMLFLASTGVNARAQFVQILQARGISLVIAGVVIAILSVLVGLLLTNYFFKMNVLSAMGALCASMTNPLGLNAVNTQTNSNHPALSYACVYPAALISKIVLTQILVEVLHRLL